MRPSVCGPAHGDKLATRCFSSGESLSRSEPVAIKLGPHERPTNDRASLTGVLGGAFKGRRRLPEQRLLPVPREIRRIGFRAHPDLSFGLPRRGRMTYQATASGGHAGVALESHLGLELGAPELNGDHGHLGGHITSSVKVSFIHGPTVSALPDSIRLQMATGEFVHLRAVVQPCLLLQLRRTRFSRPCVHPRTPRRWASWWPKGCWRSG